MTELDPCIKNDVLVDMDAGFTLGWTDCADAGISGCKSVPLLEETDPSWSPPYTDDNVFAYATHDDAGSGADMMIVQENSSQPYWRTQFDVFDIKTQTRLAEWRDQQEPAGSFLLWAASIEGPEHATAYMAHAVLGGVAAFGSAAALGTANPMISKWTPFVDAALDDHIGGSWTLFSDSPATYCVNATGQCGLYDHFIPGTLIDVAWRDVMFGYGQIDGWLAEVELSLNDSKILRSVPNTHVWGLRTDGLSMVWNESVGDPNIINDQTSSEVWTAPYTLDPATLAATATKVASLGPGRIGPFASYFNGMYAFVYSTDVYVVDVASGKSQLVSAIPGRHPISLAYVDHSAIWEVLSDVGYHYIFVSIPLAP